MTDMKMKVLTPVHIGTGQAYSPHEYVFHQGKKSGSHYVVRIDMGKFFNSLDENQKKRYIEQVRTDNNFSLNKFFKDESIGNLQDIHRYLIHREKNVLPKSISKIRECIRTADTPYIPGSSIKGAIRTALLWKYFSDNPRKAVDKLKDELRGRVNKKFFGKDLTDRVFAYKVDRNNRYDPKNDVMKFLLVSDFMLEKNIQTTLQNIKTWSLQGKIMNPKNFTINAECITKGSNLEGSISISDQIDAIKGTEMNQIRDVFESLGLSDPLEKEKIVPEIKRLLTDFNRDVYEKEFMLMDQIEIKESSADKLFRKNLKNIRDLIEEKNLIRIGFGIGTSYQTILGIIEDEDPDLFAKIVTDLKLGKYPRNYNGSEISPPYPKTVELTSMNWPVGWVLME